MSGTAPITTAGLGKEYLEGFLRSRKVALKPVTFEVRQGSVHAIIGPNGSGKSTTLHLLLGFLSPSQGSVRLFGRDPRSPEARARIGFLCEVPTFDPFLTGKGVLRLLDRLGRGDPATRPQRIELVLTRFDLLTAATRPVSKYSKGMMQRLGLAQAFLREPDLLILDEPMSGMDPAGRHSVKELLRERRDSGRTTLLSTHILADVEDLADDMLVLKEGAAVFQGSVASAYQPSELTAIIFHSADAAPLLATALGVAISPLETLGHYRVVVPQGEKADLIIARIVSRSGRIVSVLPLRQDLESVFLELTR